MLSYTGHPFYDVGVATICAFAEKRDPATITAADLDSIVEYMAEHYIVNPLKSFLTVAFPDSGFTNPAFEKTPAKRLKYANEVLNAWKRAGTKPGQRCVFTGEPAVFAADRRHIPLITGKSAVNFFPNGNAGLPVSGLALVAIHAFPLGSAKIDGRLFLVHSDNPDIMYSFAKRFLKNNQRAVLAKGEDGVASLQPEPRRPTTLLIDSLLSLEDERQRRGEDYDKVEPMSITAYHVSNFGQSPALDMYHVPMEMSNFLIRAMTPPYRPAWDALRARGWQLSQPKRKGGTSPDAFEPTYNALYEDLFRLPEEAPAFIRRYFLRRPSKTHRPGDPTSTYSLLTEANLVSFALTELFLKEVTQMQQERIDTIRSLGDVLAQHVMSENDRKFFHSFMTAQRYDELRAILIKASTAQIRSGRPPLIDFESYIRVFEEGSELPYSDWRLARDLVLIRMIERLHQMGWLQEHPDELAEPATNDEEDNEF